MSVCLFAGPPTITFVEGSAIALPLFYPEDNLKFEYQYVAKNNDPIPQHSICEEQRDGSAITSPAFLMHYSTINKEDSTCIPQSQSSSLETLVSKCTQIILKLKPEYKKKPGSRWIFLTEGSCDGNLFVRSSTVRVAGT